MSETSIGAVGRTLGTPYLTGQALRDAYSQLRAERDRARILADTLEAQVAAALALHHPYEQAYDEPRPYACREDALAWPCPTARALGVEP
jgi:dsRNA-specific ribonuclease